MVKVLEKVIAYGLKKQMGKHVSLSIFSDSFMFKYAVFKSYY